MKLNKKIAALAAFTVAMSTAGFTSATAAQSTPAVVGILLQNPAPSDGGVPVGGAYTVTLVASDGDQTTTAPTDRAITLTAPAGVTVTSVDRMVPGRDRVVLTAPGSDRTVTDTAVKVPVAAGASWSATLQVDEGTPVGTVLTTVATVNGVALTPVATTVVAADAAACTPTADTTLCAAAGTGGGPDSPIAMTSMHLTVTWVSAELNMATATGKVVDRIPIGDGQVHVGQPLAGAPQTVYALAAYLHTWVTTHKAEPGWYTLTSAQYDRHYGVNNAGGVYTSGAEFLALRNTATEAVAGLHVITKRAPKPTVIVATPKIAG